MSGNTIGKLFTVPSFGESHGPAIGCIVDGCPPGMALSEADLQNDLDRRKPGTSRHTTQRREADAVKILSGVFEGKTTGTPIGLLIENTDQRSKDYTKIAETFRPGHADYTYQQKYGFRDYRGGGRSSARETAMRVAAGGKLPLTQGSIQMSGHAIEVRLCAEDAAKGFLPSTGRIAAFDVPAGTGQRLETGVEAGGAVSPFYDSMIAKLIGFGADRDAAVARTLAMLDGAFVAGPTTNAGFLYALLDHADVRAANMDTGLIGRELIGAA